MNTLIVTTVYNPSEEIEKKAIAYADKLHTKYVARLRLSLDSLKSSNSIENILTVTANGPVLHTRDGKYFFHLNMAELRIKNIIQGKQDHMLEAMNLSSGMSVLDCTLGLATDAIVASYSTGSEGIIIGLESSPVLALIAQEGLSSLNTGNDKLNAAMRHIEVKPINHLDYLAQLPEKSFDVVYFDPMFRQPIYQSSNLKPIRHLANTEQLSLLSIKLASRVAKRRIVIKEAQNSREFARLGITNLTGGKYSSVQYGIIEVS